MKSNLSFNIGAPGAAQPGLAAVNGPFTPRPRRAGGQIPPSASRAEVASDLASLNRVQPIFGAPAARAIDLVKVYGEGNASVRALDGVSVEFERARFTAIMGPSGSGKSTLMHCMAGLDSPTGGQVFIGADEIGALNDVALTRMRRDRVGFVFQAYNLVPTLTARENITLPCDLSGKAVDPKWFDFLVEQLGVRERLSHRPAELSGGQQQRVACARALIGRPAVIFADEPTGNLDSLAAGEVLSFMRRSVSELGQTIVMVTHDPRGAAHADRVIFLRDGRMVGELFSPTPDSVIEYARKLAA